MVYLILSHKFLFECLQGFLQDIVIALQYALWFLYKDVGLNSDTDKLCAVGKPLMAGANPSIISPPQVNHNGIARAATCRGTNYKASIGVPE